MLPIPVNLCSDFHGLQRLEVDVLEFDARVVTLEADVPLLAQDAGVLLAVLLDVVVEVGVHQSFAVIDDRDLAALVGRR